MMNAAATAAVPSMALDALLSAARGKTATLDPRQVVAHVRQVTGAADVTVCAAALDAMLRRVAAAKAATLAVARSKAEGCYRVGSGPATYRVRLWSVAPLEASCGCRDFTRNALGVCKHVVAVLLAGGAPASKPRSGLRWNPVRPFEGPGDWLARVQWAEGAPPRPSAPVSLADAAARRRFRAGSLEQTHADAPRRRLELVRTLLAVARRADEPALWELLQQEQQRLHRCLDAPWAKGELERALASLRTPLFDHQREGVRRFLEAGRLVLADDMGLGKTAQAIASCHALLATGRVTRVMVVVPAALKGQWLREWSQFSAEPAAVVDGGAEERAAAYQRARAGALIVNYEQVLRDVDAIERFAPEVVVLDEAQRIKNWQTRTAAVVKRLQPRYRLVMTGTPMENRLAELASVVEWVDDLALEPKWRLGVVHAQRDAEGSVVGAQGLETLRSRLEACLLRRSREAVFSRLPARRDERAAVELTPGQRDAHDALERPIARLFATSRRRPLLPHELQRLMTLLNRQRMICDARVLTDFEQAWPELQKAKRPTPALLESLGSPKLLELRRRIAARVRQGKKVVVFSQWRRMLRLAEWVTRDVLEEHGARAAFFTGGNRKTRDDCLVRFHDDPEVVVLFATDAGGVGLNLQRAASCVMNLDLPWNPAVLEQRIARVHRHGQLQPVEVVCFVSEGIEQHIEQVVGGKQALFRGLFDGRRDAVSFEQSGSFLERLREVAAPPVVAAPPGVADDGVARVKALLAGVEVRAAAPGRVVLEAPVEVMTQLAELLQRAARLAGSSS